MAKKPQPIVIVGRTPGGNRERLLQIWLEDGGAAVNLWIHPPNSGDDAGWQVQVSAAALRDAIRKLDAK
jgi:hypothetical protein